MDQVVSKLSEIEAAATKIMENGAVKKTQLAKEMELKTADFDKKVDADTQKTLSELKERLSNNKDSELEQLQRETKLLLDSLDDQYNHHHEEIAKQLLNKIIGA